MVIFDFAQDRLFFEFFLRKEDSREEKKKEKKLNLPPLPSMLIPFLL